VATNKIVTKYQFPQSIYFNAVIKNIALLVSTFPKKPLRVMDFGCGTGLLKSFIQEKDTTIDVDGYDIDPDLSDIEDPWAMSYDIWVFNHVLMYMNEREILDILDKIKLMKPR